MAVTFDDGPAASTNQVLDILARKHATASFFMLAPKVRANPGVVKRMRAAGHTVASHTATHRDLTRLSQPEVPVSYTHLTLPTIAAECRSRWSPYH